jgi:hypothetical protein
VGEDELKGDGAFRGVLTPCDACLQVGEFITLGGGPPRTLRFGECTRCKGSGHVHIECAEHEVDAVVRGLPPSRRQIAVRRAVAGVGLCTTCFGAGAVASVECDDEETPLRYTETPCPGCRPAG